MFSLVVYVCDCLVVFTTHWKFLFGHLRRLLGQEKNSVFFDKENQNSLQGNFTSYFLKSEFDALQPFFLFQSRVATFLYDNDTSSINQMD